MSLDYTSSEPLYSQLKKELENKIKDEVYIEKIPSERELMDAFNVSRSTVRQAVDELVKEGMLKKQAGKGTFINIKSIQDWLGNLNSTTETIERMGMTPSIKLVGKKVISLDKKMQKITGLKKAYCFERLRFANSIPIGIERNYYSLELGSKLKNYNLNEETLYDLIENEIGVEIYEAEQIIRAEKIKREDAELLNLPLNAPVLSTQRRVVNSKGTFIEFEDAVYRSDLYSFKLKLSRKN